MIHFGALHARISDVFGCRSIRRDRQDCPGDESDRVSDQNQIQNEFKQKKKRKRKFRLEFSFEYLRGHP